MLPFYGLINHSVSNDGWSSNMNNHSWDSLEGLACNMMKLVLVIFSLADRLAAPNNRNIVKHRIRGLLLTSRLAVPGGRDLLNQGKLQRVIYLSPSDTG